jgi:hypothetical protein
VGGVKKDPKIRAKIARVLAFLNQKSEIGRRFVNTTIRENDATLSMQCNSVNRLSYSYLRLQNGMHIESDESYKQCNSIHH